MEENYQIDDHYFVDSFPKYFPIFLRLKNLFGEKIQLGTIEYKQQGVGACCAPCAPHASEGNYQNAKTIAQVLMIHFCLVWI